MRQKRRNFTSSFKTKVVLEALKERETIQQIGVKFEVHPNQITTWKKQFLENADAAFGQQGKDDELLQAHQQLDELYKQIGQMKVETDWLKKKLLCCRLNNAENLLMPAPEQRFPILRPISIRTCCEG